MDCRNRVDAAGLKNNDVPSAWSAHSLNRHRLSFCTFLQIKLKWQPSNKASLEHIT